MIRIATRILVFGLGLVSIHGTASPLTTVLHRPSVEVPASVAAGMARGFARCSPDEALPAIYRAPGGKYKIAKKLHIGGNVRIIAVTSEVDKGNPSHPIVRVRYTFDRPVEQALPLLEELAGRSMRDPIDYSQISASHVEFDPDADGTGYSLQCERYAE